jgi:hypothetical protein
MTGHALGMAGLMLMKTRNRRRSSKLAIQVMNNSYRDSMASTKSGLWE